MDLFYDLLNKKLRILKIDCDAVFKLALAKFGWPRAIILYLMCKSDEGTLGD